METRPFGKTGESFPILSFGGQRIVDEHNCTEDEAVKIVNTAIDRGIRYFDTAWIYSQGQAETRMGKVVKDRRDEMWIATKTWDTTKDGARKQLETSLTRLQTDYVDFFMIHWPRENMLIEPMMEALNNAVVAGKARYVGCCNFPAWLLAHCNGVAQRNGWAKLVGNQIPYNLIERGAEVEVMPQAVADNIAITTYRSLALGLLTGKYKPGQPIPYDSRGQTDKRVPEWLEKYGDAISGFYQFAADRNLHPAQLAVAWVRHSPGVAAPIVGVSSERQLQASIDAFDVTLSADEYAELTEMFDTAVKEESGGNFAPLRRALNLVAVS